MTISSVHEIVIVIIWPNVFQIALIPFRGRSYENAEGGRILGPTFLPPKIERRSGCAGVDVGCGCWLDLSVPVSVSVSVCLCLSMGEDIISNPSLSSLSLLSFPLS